MSAICPDCGHELDADGICLACDVAGLEADKVALLVALEALIAIALEGDAQREAEALLARLKGPPERIEVPETIEDRLGRLEEFAREHSGRYHADYHA